MKLSILKVILWPKDTNHKPRIITFLPGKINIITGQNATGKSTLLSIIDYCLGSGKCSIPVGLIRNVTSWFGLHLQLPNTEMIVARRNPEQQQSTSDLYWEEGLGLTVPTVVNKNARVDDLKNRFNQISHLSTLDLSATENVGYASRPSFRDMAAFNFQPQHIVANPFTFFFKADTTEHREKLRAIFPLVLGAIDSNTLAKQRELKDLEREHDKFKRDLDVRLNAAQAWEAEVGSYYLQAQSMGLLPNSPSPEASWILDKYIMELQKVPETLKTMGIPDIPEGTSETSVEELTKLINEEDKIGQEIGSIRRRLSKLDQLSSSINEYGATLTSQEDRLHGVGWLEKKLKNTHQCPVCGSEHKNCNPHLDELIKLAEDLKLLTTAVHQAPAKLDKEMAGLRRDLRKHEARITETRQKRIYLERQSEVLSEQRQYVRQIYLFVGRVEQALENVSSSRNVDDLSAKVSAFAQKITELKKDLDPRALSNRLDAALDTVSAKTADYAEILRLEHSDTIVRFNLRELTLQFSPLSGRKDFLWEVGSGQNWVGYHIAGLLALHEHFISLTDSPVPRFLFIDQPSQVYFPHAWPSLEQMPNGRSTIESSSDIDGVHRIFSALYRFISTVANQFQVIVTEHSGPITWKGIPDVHLVGNWRNGYDEFLIPDSWINS